MLAPRDRNKTITCLAGAEPVTGPGMPGVQRLQFFLSESPREVEQVNDRRLELLREQPGPASLSNAAADSPNAFYAFYAFSQLMARAPSH